jgi:hypothetical protein
VEAAAALGVQAIHFLGYEALIPALCQHGVVVSDGNIHPHSTPDG